MSKSTSLCETNKMKWAGKSWKELNVQSKKQRYVVGRFGSRELNESVDLAVESSMTLCETIVSKLVIVPKEKLFAF